MRSICCLLLTLLALTGCQFCDRYFIDGKSQVIRVYSGERYYFDLEEDVKAGYSWDYACEDADIEVLIDHEAPPEPKKGEAVQHEALGTASVRIRIHRGFDGPADVRFFYRRPGEKEAAKQFAIAFYKRTGDVAFWKK